MKVWLDDIREAPEGWVRASTAEEAIALLKTGKVELISLDHDLGENLLSGYDVTCWIEQEVVLAGFVPPQMTVHSMNPVGRANMWRAIEQVKALASRAAVPHE